MTDALEFVDDDGDKLHARKLPKSMPGNSMVRIVVTDTNRARYYLSTDERHALAMFLLDGLFPPEAGGDADSAKAKLTAPEYAELSKLIRRAALSRAAAHVEALSPGATAQDALTEIEKLYDAV